jgi:OmpR-family two-component system manganese-sensing sensor histidine kinase
MFQTTRRRLAIWYTTVTAVLLIIFATGIYAYFYKTLIDRIDDTLKHVIEIVEPSLVIEKGTAGELRYKVNLDTSFYQHPQATNQVEDDHIDLEWFSANGELLWQTLEPTLPIPLSFNSGGKTIRISDDYLLRQITKRIQKDHYVLGYLRVSHPLFDVIKPIRQLIVDLSIAIIVLVIAVGSIGWFLSGIAIQPVKESYQSLKQFTADASHELRNPIATIKTNIDSLLSYPEMDLELQKKQFKIIDRLTGRLASLVNDLLFLARSDSGIISDNFQPLPLDALLVEVVEEQKIIAKEKGIDLSLIIINNEEYLKTNLADDLFIINGDWSQINRVFTNLISNAIFHGINSLNQLEKLTIKVSLSIKKKQNKIFYQVTVEDNGVGIPDSLLPHLFDRFYRGDHARTYQDDNYSTGLGLAIAQAIVENHQGKITVESKINQGSKFTVTLPSEKSI